MNNEALLATVAAKSAAHSGLADALEYGTTRVLRINGLDHVYAKGDHGSFVVTANVNGTVRCNGYVVNSTCRDLTYDVIRAYRAR